MSIYLTYSPSVEAYIAANRNGSVTYYDVSGDVTKATVKLIANDASSFTIRLANKNRKYDGLFSAMDRIAIFATKTKKTRLLTGYITSVTALQMYANDIVVEGKCAIYRMQNLFWDKQLKASQELMSIEKFEWNSQFSNVILALLSQVGGYAGEQIRLGEIPSQVIAWAQEMYSAQKEDTEQALAVVSSFWKMLKDHGPKMGGGMAGGAVSGDVNAADKQAVFNFLVNKLKWTKACACGAMGAWEAESGIDPTGIEGIYSEPHQLGPKKQAAMKDWQSYTLNTLFPMYASGGRGINHSAYRGTDGKFYPGLGLAQWTGPRATGYLDYCKSNKMKWYNMDAALSFVTHEIKTTYTSLDSPSFWNIKSPREACSMFVRIYEHADYGGDPTRQNNAQMFWDQYAK